ncbi:MAG TPA: MGMT family protein [Ktedonobacterales bacterium]|jgi:methylated-DNA-protein-cysteine methyltransferase-like protein
MAITKDQAGKLSAQVYALVRACPKGRVTTYGWLAGAVGYPRGARVVGWIMSATPANLDIPAHRVINKDGVLTGSKAFGAKDRMRTLLEGDGVTLEEDGHVDMKRYGWDPRLDLNPDELQEILDNAKTLRVEPPDTLMRLLNDDPASPFKLSDPL